MRHSAPGGAICDPVGGGAQYYHPLPPAEIEINSGPSKQ